MMMPRADLKKWLESRYEKNPNTLLFARLADVYIREGRIDEAIEICLKGIQANPSYVTGNFILGKAYLAKGEYSKAELELKKVLAYDRQFPTAHKFLGDLMIRMGYESKAHAHHRDLWHLDPLEETAASLVRKNKENPDWSASEVTESASPSAQQWKTATEEKINWKKELESLFPENRISRIPPAPSEKTQALPPETVSLPEPKTETPETTPTPAENTDLTELILETENETPLGSAESVVETENGTPLGSDELTDRTETIEPVEEMPPAFEPSNQQPLIADAEDTMAPSLDIGQEPSDLLTDEKIVSPTLGEIYVAQGQYTKALAIFETLLKRTPDDYKLKQKIEELKKKM